jgi:hypothetical protein
MKSLEIEKKDADETQRLVAIDKKDAERQESEALKLK